MNKIDPLAIDMVHGLRQKMMLQLTQIEDEELNIFEKQLQMKETVNKAIRVAKSAPNGEVSIIVLKSGYKRKTSNALDLLRHEKVRVSFFNTSNKEGHLERTFIFIKPTWNDDFIVFSGSLNFPYDKMKEV